jgi:transcription antitermination factor NusA-like protein
MTRPLPAFEDDARERFALGARSEAARFVGSLLVETVRPLSQGELEIVSIARRPGVLSKVAIRSKGNAQVVVGADDVARVRDLLDGERVEIIPWHPDPRRYVQHALGLGEAPAMLLVPAIQHAHVFLGEIDLRGIAGWRNLNVILASSLTGWRVRLLPIAQTAAWRRLRAALTSGAAVPATVVGPREVEVYGLYARLRRTPASVGAELLVRVMRMDPDEGRITVTERLRSTGQLLLPIAV